MQNIRHFNRGTVLTILTVALSGVQSVLLHIGTTDFAHSYFSVYSFVEFFILLIAIITGFRQKLSVIIFLFAFLFEVVWFFIYELPISPDILIMLIVAVARTYIFVWLLRRMVRDNILHQ